MEVAFEKPNLEELTRRYTCVDLHFHTTHSDGLPDVRETLKRAKELNIGIAITDHNEISGSLEACRKSNGTLVIPGIEVATYERIHLLFYFPEVKELEKFYQKLVKPNKMDDPFSRTRLRTKDLILRAKDYNCLCCAAHPSASGFTGVNRVNLDRESIDKIDLVEVLNGHTSVQRNLRAGEWARRYRKAPSGGSDGHTIGELGNVITYSKASDLNSFLRDLALNRAKVVGKKNNQFKTISIALLKEFHYLKNNYASYPTRLKSQVKSFFGGIMKGKWDFHLDYEDSRDDGG
ncbi:MAG: PHP domain-containing protein, partial [Deltaproteobacteria bacterium]